MIEATSDNVCQKMDAMYRYQRYFYDATRKYYLLGRDRLLRSMQIAAGENVVEIGCGTGRNLVLLARRHKNTYFFGLDASSEMLSIASARIAKNKIQNIKLQTALADDLGHETTFGLSEPFDAIFFSYSISMIPTWRAAIEKAFDNLKPGGGLYIVDFFDHADLPAWFRFVLRRWLGIFHVQYREELMPFLMQMESSGRASLEIESIARRYSFIAAVKKTVKI